jgi:hypothetical protein
VALVGQLAAEVKTLRMEVHKLQLAWQQAQVAQLERELQQAQAGKQRLEQQEREFNRELTELTELLGRPDLEAEERAELEAMKAKLAQSGPPRFLAQQQQVAEQEAELAEQLGKAQQRLQQLREKARQLRSEG